MYAIRVMTLADYESVIELMRATPGICLRDADSREATARYLERNPGLSFVCLLNERLVGCLMSGHDGRRGYLQHLVVAPGQRRAGIASTLVERCLGALEALGIRKFHLDVVQGNALASAFWARRGWTLRTDIERYSLVSPGAGNA